MYTALNLPRFQRIITVAESNCMSHNSAVSSLNLTLLESYESLKSLLSNEKCFIGFGLAF